MYWKQEKRKRKIDKQNSSYCKWEGFSALQGKITLMLFFFRKVAEAKLTIISLNNCFLYFTFCSITFPRNVIARFSFWGTSSNSPEEISLIWPSREESSESTSPGTATSTGTSTSTACRLTVSGIIAANIHNSFLPCLSPIKISKCWRWVSLSQIVWSKYKVIFVLIG